MEHLPLKLMYYYGRPINIYHLVTFDIRLFTGERGADGERRCGIVVVDVEGEGWSTPFHVDLAVVEDALHQRYAGVLAYRFHFLLVVLAESQHLGLDFVVSFFERVLNI